MQGRRKLDSSGAAETVTCVERGKIFGPIFCDGQEAVLVASCILFLMYSPRLSYSVHDIVADSKLQLFDSRSKNLHETALLLLVFILCAKHMLSVVISSNEVFGNIHKAEAVGVALVDVQ